MPRGVKKLDKSTPTMTPEARQNQLINLSYNEAEKRIRNGTATSQLLSFFLNLGTEKARLENEKLKSDLRVAEAKIKQLEENRDIKELYDNAIAAMKLYSPQPTQDDEGDYY